DYENLISESFYCRAAKLISNSASISTLRLGFNNYDTFLKSGEIINCRNIKILDLYVEESDDETTMKKYQRLAQKIKRLVKLNVDSQYFEDQ
ncbi:hypothetical protein ABPG73_008385, partial [Tetrahymena malaccensis]